MVTLATKSKLERKEINPVLSELWAGFGFVSYPSLSCSHWKSDKTKATVWSFWLAAFGIIRWHATVQKSIIPQSLEKEWLRNTNAFFHKHFKMTHSWPGEKRTAKTPPRKGCRPGRHEVPRCGRWVLQDILTLSLRLRNVPLCCGRRHSWSSLDLWRDVPRDEDPWVTDTVPPALELLHFFFCLPGEIYSRWWHHLAATAGLIPPAQGWGHGEDHVLWFLQCF